MINDINSLRIYMKEINKFTLLTRDEEIRLAQNIQNNGCDKSLQKLIECNLRLVVKIATDYQRNLLPIEDFVAEGNLGLIKAAERYDPDKNKGCKFASYAQWWINQKILLLLTLV